MKDLTDILTTTLPTRQPLRSYSKDQLLDLLENEKHPAIRRIMAQMACEIAESEGFVKGNRQATYALTGVQ